MGNTRRRVATVLTLVLSGCGSTAQPQSSGALPTANAAISAGQSDRAITATQAYLRATPFGAGAAEAWYLQGRGFEQKAANNQLSSAQIRSTLHEARSCYLQALGLGPKPELEADIHTAYSNVAFFQDDFPVAIEQAAAGSKMSDSTTVKAFLLYRTGVCQQRLERFSDADQTYRQVEQLYPGTAVAESSHSREGLRLFYVQLATFADMAAADQMVLAMQNSGYILNRAANKNRYVVSAGPFSSYDDARRAKDHFGDKFNSAVIVP